MELLDGIQAFISFIFAFAVILGLAYITTKVVASSSFKKYKNKNMRLLEGMALGPQKSLELIKVGKKYILLGISKDSISKIDTFNEDELDVKVETYDKSLFTLGDLFARANKSYSDEKNKFSIRKKSKFKNKNNEHSLLTRALLNLKDEGKNYDTVNLDSLNRPLYDDTRNSDQIMLDNLEDLEMDNENDFNSYLKKALENEYENNDNDNENKASNEKENIDSDNVRTIKVGYDKNGDFRSVLMKLNKK